MQRRFAAGLLGRFRHAAIRSGLEAASLARGLGLAPTAAGAIFTLHHVRPRAPKPFEPNLHLEITPAFLDSAIRQLRQAGWRFVAADALPALLAGGQRGPFAAFTLDDGYRDNLEHALPVFLRHGVPFTVFVAKGFGERTHSIWWEVLADLIGHRDRVVFDFGQGEEPLRIDTGARKQAAFDRFAAFMHSAPEEEAAARIDALARRHGLEPLELTRALTMDAGELRRLAAHPLASLGAHTVSHRAIARLPEAEARREMRQSADYVAEISGTAPAAIAYPYGTQPACGPREATLAGEFGFVVGLTTRPGILKAGQQSETRLLPRLSLNGHYQKPRYALALASGLPTLLLR